MFLSVHEKSQLSVCFLFFNYYLLSNIGSLWIVWQRESGRCRLLSPTIIDSPSSVASYRRTRVISLYSPTLLSLPDWFKHLFMYVFRLWTRSIVHFPWTILSMVNQLTHSKLKKNAEASEWDCTTRESNRLFRSNGKLARFVQTINKRKSKGNPWRGYLLAYGLEEEEEKYCGRIVRITSGRRSIIIKSYSSVLLLLLCWLFCARSSGLLWLRNKRSACFGAKRKIWIRSARLRFVASSTRVRSPVSSSMRSALITPCWWTQWQLLYTHTRHTRRVCVAQKTRQSKKRHKAARLLLLASSQKPRIYKYI